MRSSFTLIISSIRTVRHCTSLIHVVEMKPTVYSNSIAATLCTTRTVEKPGQNLVVPNNLHFCSLLYLWNPSAIRPHHNPYSTAPHVCSTVRLPGSVPRWNKCLNTMKEKQSPSAHYWERPVNPLLYQSSAGMSNFTVLLTTAVPLRCP